MNRQIPSYRLYREESGESGDFWIHCETIPERTHLHNWEIAAHRHDSFFQIFYLSDGRGEVVDLGEPRRFDAPCALFIPPGAVHGFRFSRDIDGLVVTALDDRLGSITAADRGIAAFASDTRIVPLAAGDPDSAFSIDCIRRIHAELTGRGPGRMVLLEPLMIGAVVGRGRPAGLVTNPGHPPDDRDRLRIEALLTLISAHFRDHRPVSFYAGAIGVSATHLNRVARASTGLSVQGLIAQRITEAARRDLVFTPTPVQAIAYSLGYSDPAYFNRFFRRQTGMTPGRFREAERKRLAV